MHSITFLFTLLLLFSCFNVVAHAQAMADAQTVLKASKSPSMDRGAQPEAQDKQQAKQAESFGEEAGEKEETKQGDGKSEEKKAKGKSKGKSKKNPFAGIRLPDSVFEFKSEIKFDQESGRYVMAPIEEWTLTGMPGDEMSVPCCGEKGCKGEK